MKVNKSKEKKESKKVMNNKKARLFLVCGIVLILLVILIIVLVVKSNGKDISELEEIATKKYFEEGFVDVSELYRGAGVSDVDEVQYMQAQTKLALDNYFATSDEDTVDAGIIMNSIDNPYGYTIDFNGITVSGYEYSQENNTFTRVEGANSNLENIEANINMTTANYDGQKISVDKIEKVEDNKYKVYANLVEGNEGETVVAKAEMTVSIEDGEITLDECTISE